MPKFKPQFRRLLFIDRRIKDGSYPNCRALAQEWEVSPKTVQRDIDYLKYELDAPIEYDKTKHGYRYTEKTYSLPAISMSESDLFAVCIAERALRQFKDTPLHNKLTSLFDKIQQTLPHKVTIDPSWVDSRIFFFSEPSTEVDPHIWETIVSSLRENRQLQITHDAPLCDSSSVRCVDPYHLVYYRGEWYLSSFCHNRKAVRTFAVSRIKQAKMLSEHFEMAAAFSQKRMFGDHFGIMWGDHSYKVRIRFDRELAPYIKERTWHHTQSIKGHRDGAITLAFACNHLTEVKDWVLSWGPGAMVLGPKKLVAEITESLKGSLARYSEKA